MGCSVLTIACLGGFVAIVKMLLKHGAIVDYQDKVSESMMSAFRLMCIHIVIGR